MAIPDTGAGHGADLTLQNTVFRPASDGNEPCRKLNKAARLLIVAPKNRNLAETGEIEGINSLPNGPRVFSRSGLGKQEAQQIRHRARQISVGRTRSYQ
jgi:hypothetical protein